jgi:hypothetical protein
VWKLSAAASWLARVFPIGLDGPLHAVIGLGKEHAKCEEFARKLPEGEFDSNRAAALLGANSRKVAHDWLNKLAEMGVVQLIAAGIGSRPARWLRTGKAIDELVLPSVATVRHALVTSLPGVSAG